MIKKPFALCSFIFILSAYLQSQIFYQADILYALEGGKRLLNGGSYALDMFETNPPLIFYFTVIANYISLKIHLEAILVFYLMVYSFILYCLFISNVFLKQLKLITRQVIMISLTFSLLILPADSFAEREHIMLALFLPFVFMRFASLKETIALPARITISLIAAIGLAFKPHFLIAFLFSELCIAYWKKDIFFFIRLEWWVIGLTMLCYLASIALLTPGYYYTVLPFVLHYYSSVFFLPWSDRLVLSPSIMFFMVTGLFLYMNEALKKIDILLLSTAFGFWLSFILQAKGWYYHGLPTLSLCFILSCRWGTKFYFQSKVVWLPIGLVIGPIICLIAPPFKPYKFSFIQLYSRSIAYKYRKDSYYKPLIKYAKTHAYRQNVLFLSTTLAWPIPIAYYADVHMASRYPYLWPLSGVLQRQRLTNQCDDYCQKTKAKLKNDVYTDLLRFKPKLIFIDNSEKKPYLYHTYLSHENFFFNDKKIKPIWQHYQFVKQINNFKIYGLKPSRTHSRPVK